MFKRFILLIVLGFFIIYVNWGNPFIKRKALNKPLFFKNVSERFITINIELIPNDYLEIVVKREDDIICYRYFDLLNNDLEKLKNENWSDLPNKPLIINNAIIKKKQLSKILLDLINKSF